MPFNFTGSPKSYVAKLGVVSDGETFTVADGYGHTVTSTLSSYTAFAANPVRSATGVWSVKLKDSAIKILEVDIQTVLPSGTYLSVQLQPTTTIAFSNGNGGQLVLNWTFNVAGTPTDLPNTGTPQFRVYVVYAEGT